MSREQVVLTGVQQERTTSPALEMIDLCKSFGTLKAVDHLSLTVNAIYRIYFE